MGKLGDMKYLIPTMTCDKLYWKVPVIYTLPSKGRLGKVGEIWIDADNGELILEKSTEVEVMRSNAKRILLGCKY